MITKQYDIPYGTHALETYDLYLPEKQRQGNPLVIHFHGGSLTGGHKTPHKHIDDLVEKGYLFGDCNYRLMPEATLPEIMDDAAMAVAAVLRRLSGQYEHVFIAGDSAGAYISMMLMFRPQYLEQAGVPYGTVSGFFHDDAMGTPDFDTYKQVHPFLSDVLEHPDCPLRDAKKDFPYPPVYFTTFGKGITGFPEYVSMAVATMVKLGYGRKVRFDFFPGMPHCGNFGREIDGLNAYAYYGFSFYEAVLRGDYD
ncbi:MAG: alpha/beta hydrolase [Clostridia bacterium]|nr:alpha/beta hydrolase [Clostridia bacterium]